MIFFGHSNDIISSAATTDKIYLASADYGPKNALIIWHAKSGNIAFTMSNKYPDGGVIWMCFSEDNNMLLTLSGEIPQELSLWKWKTMETSPYYSYKYEKQDQIQDESGIMSSVVNLTSLYDEKACKQAGDFTQTVFSPVSVLAITGTTKGKIVLWSRIHHGKEKTDQHNNCSLTMDPKQRICLRMMQIFSPHCSITCLTICEDLIAKKYTFKQAVLRTLGKKLEKLSPLKRNDFIVCCSNGYAGYVKISSSEVTDVLSGTSYAVKSVIVHPLKPYIYVGDYKGEIQKWNYNTKLTSVKFSPDPQHLIATDEAAYVYRFQLYLIVPPEVYQLTRRDNIPPEEPKWQYND
ncbi:cilia-and flagella-associated protein 251 [Caerostris extrusa]|uniref:Cilia-and flagella-associated protein 251 n=1 Tax=Caerostris extrusa TaxID=172846 RepID=A0AAV4SU92_CAEEX|nr:cilia-and flagella-associated protein 251 [Caerostris extrusa]